MIEDRIEEAARKYAFNECSKKDIDQYDLDSLLFDAFCSGINWFKENLCHDGSEEPDKGPALLIEFHPLSHPEHFQYEAYITTCIMGNGRKELKDGNTFVGSTSRT